jgi:hypothetical protein
MMRERRAVRRAEDLAGGHRLGDRRRMSRLSGLH